MGAVGAQAAGLSAGQAGTVLGQPLDFVVQVRLEAGDTVSPDCVNAEVHLSDQRVPPSGVRTVIDQQSGGQARVRVQTQQAIDEPVVSITLRVGCAAPISRRFVVFADPPHSGTVAAAAAAPVSGLVPLAAAAPQDTNTLADTAISSAATGAKSLPANKVIRPAAPGQDGVTAARRASTAAVGTAKSNTGKPATRLAAAKQAAPAAAGAAPDAGASPAGSARSAHDGDSCCSRHCRRRNGRALRERRSGGCCAGGRGRSGQCHAGRRCGGRSLGPTHSEP